MSEDNGDGLGDVARDGEIQLISDGDGLAVIGEAAAVERFLVAERLPSRDLALPRLGAVLGAGSGVAQAGSEIAANSGRWVKLTKESAGAIKKYGLRENAKTGVSTGVLKGPKGQVKGFVEFAKTPGTLFTNPAILAGAAGIMAQAAMQQTMDEILDYLARIEEKVDDVLRAQKDAVLAQMIGVGFVVDEAMTIREVRGRVDEVTWSKVQGAPATIAETQAYALQQLDAVAEKLETRSKIRDLATTARDAELTVREWLAVLARCFQLQDAVAVLELDRVLDGAPTELNAHRLGLKAARLKRLKLISRTTAGLLGRIDAAAGTANLKVLLHPSTSKDVVHSANEVGRAVVNFHVLLGLEGDRQSVDARRWTDAAAEVRDRALETGAEGVDAARRFGVHYSDRTKLAVNKVSNQISELKARRGRS